MECSSIVWCYSHDRKGFCFSKVQFFLSLIRAQCTQTHGRQQLPTSREGWRHELKQAETLLVHPICIREKSYWVSMHGNSSIAFNFSMNGNSCLHNLRVDFIGSAIVSYGIEPYRSICFDLGFVKVGTQHDILYFQKRDTSNPPHRPHLFKPMCKVRNIAHPCINIAH